MKLAGMASNRGRNLLNLADRAPGGATLAVVLANRADAPVLDAAAARGIPTEVVEREEGEERAAHERRVLDALGRHDFDLVCLDGYMRILSPTYLDAAPTTLNVHPSLLPAFPGMDAHEQVLDAGVKVTGCTVHVVDETVDGGPIVTQEPVPVRDGDDRADLKERVLFEGEFVAYPRAVRWFAEGGVAVDWDAHAVRIEGDDGGRFPARRVASDDRAADLRYGENPHQDAALYADPSCDEPNVAAAPQVGGGKGMSYVNYVDAEGGLDLVKEFESPAAAVVKHANPAGCATADSPAEAYDCALSTDPMSAFGGVVVLNRECDVETAERIVDSVKHVVVAPGYADGALDVLAEREDMRVLDVSRGGENPSLGPDDRTETVVDQPVVGGRLVQDRDLQRLSRADFEIVTERTPTDEQVETMLFAWQVCKHVTSNAIVFADGTETVGLGVGQVSRVDAVRLAAMKADEHAEGKSATGAVMASDAFFPFPDGIEVAADAGIGAVVQPGGSINDEDVIAAADEHDLAMAFTGMRCFRHD